MREILFRGKNERTNEWEFGSLHIQDGEVNDDDNQELEYRILGLRGEIDYVIPETVGQYTGLTDKNGTKIFEGDILRYFDNEIQVVKWGEDFACLMLYTYAEYERKKGRKVVKEKSEGWNYINDYPLSEMAIIGNIHDNPELLGGEEE